MCVGSAGHASMIRARSLANEAAGCFSSFSASGSARTAGLSSQVLASPTPSARSGCVLKTDNEETRSRVRIPPPPLRPTGSYRLDQTQQTSRSRRSGDRPNRRPSGSGRSDPPSVPLRRPSPAFTISPPRLCSAQFPGQMRCPAALSASQAVHVEPVRRARKPCLPNVACCR
jgi:hypothetical protein